MNARVAAPASVRGFTLIELLVVVSVIVLLISMLMPALQSAREHFRVVACANNLKQMGNASSEYRTDDGTHLGIISFNTSGSLRFHNDELRPLTLYGPSTDFSMYICPSTDRFINDIEKLSEQGPRGTDGEGKGYESYGAYWNKTHLLKTASRIRGLESETWLIFDIDNTGSNWEMTDVDNHGPRGGNALHADYHVEFIPGPDWGARRWHAQRTIYPIP